VGNLRVIASPQKGTKEVKGDVHSPGYLDATADG